ncbi:hypothetical protein [Ruegeria lacuscaerulensis]|uniref:hypothetical protein n=1 Tax=Ruegeria lacuscaerulensis TaxID=55218 RepID=UPI00147AECCB|nr:hypothetical protein [Ruegeria lacuscaerulensis]
MRRRRQIKRDRMHGRVYAISGGQPNQPLVCMVADVFWGETQDDWQTWLDPQVISVQICWFAAKDHAALRSWIKADRQAWRDEVLTREHLPVIILLDVSQAPASAELLEPLRDGQTNITAIMLNAGTDNALVNTRQAQSATTSVGAKWLISHFDGRVAKDPAQALRYSRPYVPDRIVMSFDDFVDGDPPLMDRKDIRSSMSAAESLMKKAANADGEALLSLSADEVTASAVMFTLLAADMCRPSADYQPPGSNIYGGMDPEERRRAAAKFTVI